MRVGWRELGTGEADAADGQAVELTGFIATSLPASDLRHFLLVPEAPCCVGCVSRDVTGAVEVFAATPMPFTARPVRLNGTWHISPRTDGGWRYQLRDARSHEPPGWSMVTRRTVLTGASLMCLAATAPGAIAQQYKAEARRVLDSGATIDIHSHAGSILGVRYGTTGLGWVVEPMRDGGMAVACLAITSDGPCHKLMADGIIHPYRDPDPGELYEYSQRAFARVRALISRDDLAVITDANGVAVARSSKPSAIVAAEGADFLEGRIERVEEAYERWQLRHLQLTHYRVNELGDIQTEAPQHGGLTDFGAEVIRTCNRRGIVVDVAHGTFDLVKRAVSVTAKPLVLSHTSLARQQPGPRSRLISPEHAKLVASTGGVVGVWPPITIFSDLPALANGMLRMADIVGVDHVGLGSDMLGLPHGAVFGDYRHLPDLAEALLTAGFSSGDVGKILGGNYARVFAATMA